MIAKKEFILPFGKIEFDEGFIKYNELDSEYKNLANEVASKFIIDSKEKYKDMKSIVESCENDFQEILKCHLDNAVKKLIHEGFYDLDLTTFINEYYLKNDLYEFNRHFDQVVNEFYELTLKKEMLNEYRSFRKQNRGQVIGGGFGLNGAVTGIAMAGAANMASGAIHGAFNFIGSLVTSGKVNSKLKEIYNSKEMDNILFFAAYDCIINIPSAFNIAYKKFKREPYAAYDCKISDVEQSIRLVNNLKSNNIPDDKINDVLIESINLYPYNKYAYKYALNKYKDKDGRISKLAKFVSCDVDKYKNEMLNLYYEDNKNYTTEDECLKVKNGLEKLMKDVSFKSKSETLVLLENDLDVFDQEKRTVDGFIFESEAEAKKAKIENDWIKLELKDLDEKSEDSVNLFLKKFQNNPAQFEYAKGVYSNLGKIKSTLDEDFRTVQGYTSPTRDEAIAARKEWKWWEDNEENLNTAEKEGNLASFINEAKKKRFSSQLSLDYLKELEKEESSQSLQARTFNGKEFKAIDEAKKAKLEYSVIFEKHQNIDFNNEKEVIEWLAYLNNNSLGENVLHTLIKESKFASLELDRESRVVEGVEISNKEDVELAKREFLIFSEWVESADINDEKAMLKLKEKILNESKTEMKIAFISNIDSILEELDEEIRTVEGMLYSTRENAESVKNKEKLELALGHQTRRDRSWALGIFLQLLGLVISLVIIGLFKAIGIGVVFIMYLGWIVQRVKQKKAWKELSDNGNIRLDGDDEDES